MVGLFIVLEIIAFPCLVLSERMKMQQGISPHRRGNPKWYRKRQECWKRKEAKENAQKS